MPLKCPWCGAPASKQLVSELTRLSQPAPCCGKPIMQSVWQVLFTVVLLLPLITFMLYLSKVVYEAGNEIGAIVIFLAGAGCAIYVQKYIPVVHGPGRGFGNGDN